MLWYIFELKKCFNIKNLPSETSVWDLLYWDFFVLIISEKNVENDFNGAVQLKIKNFLSQKTCDFIEWMSSYWFTSLEKIINLYWHEKMLKYIDAREKKPTKKTQKKLFYDNQKLIETDEKFSKNQLIVVPDLWAMENIKMPKTVEKIYPMSTYKQFFLFQQKIKFETKTYMMTHWNIFADWENLGHIIMVDPHKWYYKNQQDPRYQTTSVLKKMAQIYNATLQLENIYDIL